MVDTVYSSKKQFNTKLIEGSLDVLGNEVKQSGAPTGGRHKPSRNRATTPPTAPHPTGQACGERLGSKTRKAAQGVSRHHEKRPNMGDRSNVMKDMAVKHAGKIAEDTKGLVMPDMTPEPRVSQAPVKDDAAFRAYMRTLFPDWHSEHTGFALGTGKMVDRLSTALIDDLSVSDSTTPYALALAAAERLADVTGGDVRHARQVFDCMTSEPNWLDTLLQPQDPNSAEHPHLPDVQRLRDLLSVPPMNRESFQDAVALVDDTAQAFALQVAVGLSRHTHDFQALRKILNPDLDLSPDDTRVFTKPSAHWLDVSDAGCADGLLQQILHAVDSIRTPRSQDDIDYAARCLELMSHARECAMPQPAAGPPHPMETFKDNLTEGQMRDLFCWNQGMRTVDEQRALDYRLRKNSIWLWRSEAIQNSPALRSTPALLRAALWGKTPYQAARKGDGGASVKHPREMQEMYDALTSTLLQRWRAHLNTEGAQDNVPRDDPAAIERLLWITLADCFPADEQPNETDALAAALSRRLIEQAIPRDAVEGYLRSLGIRIQPRPGAEDWAGGCVKKWLDHCFNLGYMEQKFQPLKLMEQGPVQIAGPAQDAQAAQPAAAQPQAAQPQAAPADADPRTVERIFEVMRLIDKAEYAPDSLNIDEVGEFLVLMVGLHQDNTYRLEEKVGVGLNAVLSVAVAPFTSLGVRLTAIGAASAYFGIESKNWGVEVTIGQRTHHTKGGDIRASAASESMLGADRKGLLTLSLGYDSDYADGEGLKILIRRDYDHKGGIQNAMNNEGQPVLGEDGKLVQAHRYESQRVVEFFTGIAREQRSNHVPAPAEQAAAPPPEAEHQNGEAQLNANEPLDVVTRFAVKFFDSNIVSVSQTRMTTSSQKASLSFSSTVRAAVEYGSHNSQVGGNIVHINASRSQTKNATHDQNGKRALNMETRTTVTDVSSSAGFSAAIVPGLNPAGDPATATGALGGGVTLKYRINEARGQVSVLRENGQVDSVFSYSGENYKRRKDFEAALHRDWGPWAAYFGGEAQLNAAIEKTVKAARGKQNIQLMVRRRLRDNAGRELDGLDAQIARQRDIMTNPARTEKQRLAAHGTLLSLDKQAAALLARAESYEPFGIGMFSRVEKSTSTGINYFFYGINTQSVSGTREESYSAEKPAIRDTGRAMESREERLLHQLRKLRDRSKNRLQQCERRIPSIMREGMSKAARMNQLRLLDDAMTRIVILARQAVQWRRDAVQLTGPNKEETPTSLAADQQGQRLDLVAQGISALVRHIDRMETLYEQAHLNFTDNLKKLDADKRKKQADSVERLLTKINGPSHDLVKRFNLYIATVNAEGDALKLPPTDDAVETARRRREATERRMQLKQMEAEMRDDIRALMRAVESSGTIRRFFTIEVNRTEGRDFEGTNATDASLATGWRDLHQLAESVHRLHANTLQELAVDTTLSDRRRASYQERAETSRQRAGRLAALEAQRKEYRRMIARDLSDERQIIPGNDEEKDEHIRALQQGMRDERDRIRVRHAEVTPGSAAVAA